MGRSHFPSVFIRCCAGLGALLLANPATDYVVRFVGQAEAGR